MKPFEQLVEIAKKDLAFRELIAQGDAADARLTELVEERKRLIGVAFAEGSDPNTRDIDERLAEARTAADAMRSEAEKARAALAILEEKREALKPALAQERKAEHERRIKSALDRRDAAQAKIVEGLNSIVRPLGELIGAHRALEKLNARPGWDYGSRLYDKLRSALDGPFNVDWPRDKRSWNLLHANEVFYELSGVPRPAPKTAKPKTASAPIEINGFRLPETLEDPNPELGWPESGAALTDWALAFAERGWAVSTCIKNRHGDIVPEANIAGERSASSDPKRIRTWFDTPSVIGVGIFAAKHWWIFDGRQVKKFASVTHVGR